MEYREREYRESFDSLGRRAFQVMYRSSDLWIAVDRESYDEGMRSFCQEKLRALWNLMQTYFTLDQGYERALRPYYPIPDAPKILREMSEASARAGIGPMSAVAGAVARHVAEEMKLRYGCREIIVENGGDIYALLTSPMEVSVFAGESPLSGRAGFTIPPEYSPLGICTSSGTVGPSLSFGKADAVMTVCRNVMLADSYATAFANEIITADDIERIIGRINSRDDILGGIVIKDDKIGVAGKFDLRFFK